LVSILYSDHRYFLTRSRNPAYVIRGQGKLDTIRSNLLSQSVNRIKFFNRLSMGVQSFDDEELRFLGRIHSAKEARSAFALARKVGFENINLDFMFGLPGQAPETWRSTLQTAIDLHTEHLSLYSLTVEPDTALAAWVARGQVSAPDPDLAADLYELAQEMLAAADFLQYEISNWARGPLGGDLLPRFASRHNVIYWRNEPYLGFGPGAHGWLDGVRRAVMSDVGEYIRRVAAGEPYWSMEEPIPLALEMGETMMMGLRLVRAITGLDPELPLVLTCHDLDP
jgi:oxygen-independent coproporphyrinogen-3 oxidase